jgi:hypothetical protein
MRVKGKNRKGFQGLGRDAAELGVSLAHLSTTVHGWRRDDRLLARWKALRSSPDYEPFFRGSQRHANGSVDRRLEALREMQKPGECLRPTDIARFCGCSRQYIVEVERRALEKLGELMRREAAEMRETA